MHFPPSWAVLVCFLCCGVPVSACYLSPSLSQVHYTSPLTRLWYYSPGVGGQRVRGHTLVEILCRRARELTVLPTEHPEQHPQQCGERIFEA